MFDLTRLSNTSRLAPANKLREFAKQHRDALFDATGWLGGRPDLRLALSALDTLAGTRQTAQRMLRQLDTLLTLEHMHASSRPEAARFALIDPAVPQMKKFCLLADGLGNALNDYRDAIASGLGDPGKRMEA